MVIRIIFGIVKKVKRFLGFNYRFTLSPSMGWTTIARENILWDGLNYLHHNKIAGDYAEFGVWRGFTFGTAFHFASKLANQKNLLGKMRFLAFDSFEGFPELKGDDNYPGFIQGGRNCSVEDFRKSVGAMRVPDSKISIYKGWFSETLKTGNVADKEIGKQSIAFAYVDCDLYESTAEVMLFLKDKMAPGGLVVFDNWFCFGGHPNKGEQRALREFIDANTNVAFSFFKDFGWHGRGFIYNLDGKYPGIKI
jgi:O-methyltransferase